MTAKSLQPASCPTYTLTRPLAGGFLHVAVWVNEDREHGVSFSVKPTFRYRSEHEWKSAKSLPHRVGTLLVAAELLRQADAWCEHYRKRHQDGVAQPEARSTSWQSAPSIQAEEESPRG